MSTQPACPWCYCQQHEALLCKSCTGHLDHLLRQLPWLLEQLEVAAARQVRHGRASGIRSRSAAVPLPVDLTAADQASEIQSTIGSWATDVSPRGPGQINPRQASFAWALQCLLANIERLRRHPQVVQLHAWLIEVARPADAHHDRGGRAWRVIDSPIEVIPLGACGQLLPADSTGIACVCTCHLGPQYPCDIPGGCTGTGCVAGTRPAPAVACTREVIAEQGQATARCRGCGTVHDVRTRRDQVLEQAAHIQGRPAQLARAMQAAGLPCSAAAIRGMARRGRIHPTHTSAEGHAWYRLGDVRAAWHESQSPTDAAAANTQVPAPRAAAQDSQPAGRRA